MRRGLVAVGTLGVLVAAQVVVIGSGTAAAVSGIQVVVASSGYDSDASKGASARCPAGKNVLGGGGRVFDGEGHVRLSGMNPTLDTYRVIATEVLGGYDSAWEVEAYAICGTPLPGLEYVSAQSYAPSDANYAEAMAICPEGKRVVGVGGSVGWPDLIGNESLQWIMPYDPTYVLVTVGRDTTLNSTLIMPVVANAVCAYPPAGYEIRFAVVPPAGSAPYTGRMLQVSTQCPAGKTVLGAGLGGFNFYGSARVDGVFPTPDLGTVWTAARQPTASNPFRLGAWAICADQ